MNIGFSSNNSYHSLAWDLTDPKTGEVSKDHHKICFTHLGKLDATVVQARHDGAAAVEQLPVVMHLNRRWFGGGDEYSNAVVVRRSHFEQLLAVSGIEAPATTTVTPTKFRRLSKSEYGRLAHALNSGATGLEYRTAEIESVEPAKPQPVVDLFAVGSPAIETNPEGWQTVEVIDPTSPRPAAKLEMIEAEVTAVQAALLKLNKALNAGLISQADYATAVANLL